MRKLIVTGTVTYPHTCDCSGGCWEPREEDIEIDPDDDDDDGETDEGIWYRRKAGCICDCDVMDCHDGICSCEEDDEEDDITETVLIDVWAVMSSNEVEEIAQEAALTQARAYTDAEAEWSEFGPEPQVTDCGEEPPEDALRRLHAPCLPGFESVA